MIDPDHKHDRATAYHNADQHSSSRRQPNNDHSQQGTPVSVTADKIARMDDAHDDSLPDLYQLWDRLSKAEIVALRQAAQSNDASSLPVSLTEKLLERRALIDPRWVDSGSPSTWTLAERLRVFVNELPADCEVTLPRPASADPGESARAEARERFGHSNFHWVGGGGIEGGILMYRFVEGPAT